MKKVGINSIVLTLDNNETYEFLFHQCKKPEVGYTVTSPKNKGLLTQGDNVEDALCMMIDALSCWRDIKII
jgi:predicted RNase H-like HicB family nuclease